MNKDKIFDIIRKRYVAFTPEEEVRQKLISILINDYHYPITRFSLEAEIKVGQTKRRYDVLVMDKELKPFMVIECKRKEVEINEEVINQITAYNLSLLAPYLLISNSITTILLHKQGNSYIQEKEIPKLL
jgi:hypothetical protein